METSYKFGSNVAQQDHTTANKYKKWANLDNIKDGTTSKANCNVDAKGGASCRPAFFTMNQFDFTEIPNDAEIDKVIVEYCHEIPTSGTVTTNLPKFGAPAVKIYNGNDKLDEVTGSAPSRGVKTTHNIVLSGINRSQLPNLKVGMLYPENTGKAGNLYLYYVKVKIEYRVPEYSVDAKIVNTGTIFVDDNVEMDFTISNINSINNSQVATITIPDGLSYQGKSSGTGSISQSGNVLSWNSGLSNKVLQSSIRLKFKCVSRGDKTLNISTTSSQGTYSKNCSFTVNDRAPHTEMTEPSPLVIKSNEEVNYTVTSSIDYDPSGLPYEFVTDIFIANGTPSFKQNGMDISLPSVDYTYEDISGKVYTWAMPFTTTRTCTLDVKIVTNMSRGIIHNYVEATDFEKYHQIKVYPSEVQPPYYCAFALTSNEKLKLENEYPYYVSTNLFVDDPTGKYPSSLIDFGINHRIGVFNGEIPTGSDPYEYAYQKATYSECPKNANTWEEVGTHFNYNESYEVIIVVLGQPESEYPTTVNLKFTNPSIQEVFEDTPYIESANYPEPFEAIISTEDLATATGTTNKFALFEYKEFQPIYENENLNYAITGISATFNYPDKEEINIMGTLKINNSTGNRSITITDKDDEIILGGEFDRWGINFTEFDSIDSIEMILSSIGGTDSEGKPKGNIQINNPIVTVHYKEIPVTKHTVYVNGEDVRYYGLFLEDVTIPYGLNTDTKYYEIEGLDTNEAYRQNINKKEITLKFKINGCNLEESTNQIQQLAKLFTNKRTNLNKPILNRVEFTHIPQKYFLCLMDDSITNSLNINEYECTLKLTVPDGTSHNTKDIVTASTGSNQSLTRINPLIKITNLDHEITITETLSNQTFQIRDTDLVSDFDSDDYLELDCKNRIATLYKYDLEHDCFNSELVTAGVDFSSDWFSLLGDYNFSVSGGVLFSVVFNERW